MNSTGRQILKSIVQGKWLSVEYRNIKTEVTKYWIDIISVNPLSQSLDVRGFNIAYSPRPINLTIYFKSILHAEVIDGTYVEKNERLIEDINLYPEKYEFIFNNQPNFRIIDYLIECNELDNAPYRTNYILVKLLDEDTVMKNREYHLSEAQFQTIVYSFQKQLDKQNQNSFRTKLGMNILSINTKNGLYVLAYKIDRLQLIGQKRHRHVRIKENEGFKGFCGNGVIHKNQSEAQRQSTGGIKLTCQETHRIATSSRDKSSH